MQSLDVWCYVIMRHKRVNIKAGFMHIPYLPSQVVDKPNQPSMAVETVRATLETIVHVLAHGENYKAQDINYTTPHE